MPLAVTNTVLLVRDIDEVVVLRESVSLRRRTSRVVIAILLIRDDDDTLKVTLLMLTDIVHNLSQEDTTTAEAVLGLVDEITQGEPTTRRDHLRLVDLSTVVASRAVDHNILANLTKQHCDTSCGVYTAKLRLTADLAAHRPGNVDDDTSATQQLRGTSEATEHRGLKLSLKLRGILRRRDETERKHTLSTHRCQTILDDIVRHTCLRHVAEVLEDGDCTQRTLCEHTGERLLLASTARQCDLPSVGRLQTNELLRQSTILVCDLEPGLRRNRHVILVHQLRHQTALIVVLRLRVAQECNVTQLDVLVLVPLCKLVLGELVERTSETLLHLSGDGLLAVLPVDREELRDLIRTLNHRE